MENPLDEIFSFAEHAYIRQQAEDALLRCLEQGTLFPVQMLVEDLVLSGAHSVGALNELLNEAESHHSQIQDDLQRVYLALQGRLESQYGVDLRTLAEDPLVLVSWPVGRFQRQLEAHAEADAIMDAILGARQTLEDLTARMHLLRAAMAYVEDWLWGMARQWMQESLPSLPGGASVPKTYIQ
ncbi:MAG: hypothetical protein D6755_06660 [Anaerolineae bacterium]|nr:MAG: hypothetical protein D6755_06660 [Anaerolineae bacterium]